MVMTQKKPIEPTPPVGTKWRRSPCRASGGDERSKELADRIRECSRSISSLQRDLLADVAEFDRVEAWRGDGAVSMTAWLTERCAVSGATARVWTQTAIKLESLPRLADALAEGTLSLDVLSPLAQVATPATDKDLATEATHWSVKQVRELAASRKGISNETAARDFEHRTLRLNDAKCSIWASLPKDDYALAKARLIADVRDRTDAEGFQTGVGSPGYVPFDQRLCDVFVDLFRTVDSARAKGSASTESGRSHVRPSMVVHADFAWLAGSPESGTGEITGLGPIAQETARRLACDAKIIFSLEGGDGSILDQKRLRRSPTELQRIEIARRDKGCRFPSCSFTDFTEVHHVLPWEKGGETNQSNLLTLCGRHHHAVHELGWSLKGSADGLMTFTGPHGHTMASTPSPSWRGSRPMRR